MHVMSPRPPVEIIRIKSLSVSTTLFSKSEMYWCLIPIGAGWKNKAPSSEGNLCCDPL
jgi:hypothetical protein